MNWVYFIVGNLILIVFLASLITSGSKEYKDNMRAWGTFEEGGDEDKDEA